MLKLARGKEPLLRMYFRMKAVGQVKADPGLVKELALEINLAADQKTEEEADLKMKGDIPEIMLRLKDIRTGQDPGHQIKGKENEDIQVHQTERLPILV